MFTPGKWKLNEFDNQRVVGNGENSEICFCYGPNHADNARLIAAAPEMYELLKTMIRKTNCQHDWQSVIDVLSKIEGG